MNEEFLILILPIWSIVALMIWGVAMQFAKEKEFEHFSSKPDSPKINLDQLSVIIPFRNEGKRLKPLLDSIKNSTKLPNELIFVNDHSTDNSIQLIENELKNIPHQILISEHEGKKMALRKGINITGSDYILTLDADIYFDSNYFEKLEQLRASDMIILPVKMTQSLWRFLFVIDVITANLINTICNGYYKPIIASGANLLFKKSTFFAVDSIERHKAIPSGDDIFLLNDFKRANKEISLITNPNLEVRTRGPETFMELINQRVRWVSKTKKVNDRFANLVALIQFLLLLTIVGSSTYFVLTKSMNYGLFFYFIAIESLFIGTIPYLHRAQTPYLDPRYLIQYLIYFTLLPFYSIVILILSLTYKPKWKERKI